MYLHNNVVKSPTYCLSQSSRGVDELCLWVSSHRISYTPRENDIVLHYASSSTKSQLRRLGTKVDMSTTKVENWDGRNSMSKTRSLTEYLCSTDNLGVEV